MIIYSWGPLNILEASTLALSDEDCRCDSN
jgi:hypothetical protein